LIEVAAKRRMSLQEFLRWDDGTDRRYELIDGMPVAMAPPAEAHRFLLANRSSGPLSAQPFGADNCR
jgi:Uma2 family endonuclease